MKHLDKRGIKFRGWIVKPCNDARPLKEIPEIAVFDSEQAAVRYARAIRPDVGECVIMEVNYYEIHLLAIHSGGHGDVTVSRVYTNPYLRCYTI